MSRQDETIYRARLTLVDTDVRQNTAVAVEDGRIKEVLHGEELDEYTGARSRIVDLGDVALLPGQINVHSHAFQRSLRGRTEYRQSAGETDDFWSWRTEMYRLANSFGPEQMKTAARMAFLEMARCGITHVGEFHYVHHRPDGSEYDEPLALADAIVAAAEDVGIRITMLPVAYHTGDIGETHNPEQRRFVHQDVDTYLRRVEQLEQRFGGSDGVDVGVAPHSIRAVPREWMEPIAEFAEDRSMPVHIHVCEQRKEVEASREAFGAPPVEALHDWGVLDEDWTLIHGTHLSERELEILEQLRPTIGACPTTERNLGDGFLPARELVARDVPVALGSDSHTVIDPFEEMRLVEYHERLRAEQRNVLAGADAHGRLNTAEILWPMGTGHGGRSLDSEGGMIRPGAPADLVAVDLQHPSLAGSSEDTLLTDVVLSMSPGAVRDVMIAGEAVVAERHHPREHDIITKFQQMMARHARSDA